MRVIRVASAALLGVSALALTSCAPHAWAEGAGFRVGVVPSAVEAGEQVTLRATGCEQDVIVSSRAFDTVTIRRGQTSAHAVVDWDTEPGAAYEVTFHCGTFWQTVDLTIAGGRPDPDPRPHPVPRHGVQAGEGGSSAGFELREIGLGAALIAGSLGVAYRRSRRDTGKEGT
ncbi:hypothetical protein [Streptomyces sp. TRM68367]|uniref:hypothetical protein n=1 Tax=Streptomyces sp. TRM68367 TaxID=2758415 RepID=UPI00165BADC0|nr:hypothetical protein [Streptomyces sp. TRM68367]MBC9725964.1 hypothetical protein [Streptomyces sp. TRM68367]